MQGGSRVGIRGSRRRELARHGDCGDPATAVLQRSHEDVGQHDCGGVGSGGGGAVVYESENCVKYNVVQYL